MKRSELLIRRQARVLSGLADVERESPLIELTTGKKRPAWKVPGTRYAIRWALARAMYHQIVDSLRAETGEQS